MFLGHPSSRVETAVFVSLGFPFDWSIYTPSKTQLHMDRRYRIYLTDLPYDWRVVGSPQKPGPKCAAKKKFDIKIHQISHIQSFQEPKIPPIFAMWPKQLVKIKHGNLQELIPHPQCHPYFNGSPSEWPFYGLQMAVILTTYFHSHDPPSNGLKRTCLPQRGWFCPKLSVILRFSPLTTGLPSLKLTAKAPKKSNLGKLP